MCTLYATSVPLHCHRCALIPRIASAPQPSTLPDRPAATHRTAAAGPEHSPAMLTARDLATRQGIPYRTAQRLLARWYAAGHATKVPTGGRDAFAIDAATLARLTGSDGAAPH